MNNQNAEQSGGGGGIFSTMMNALVLITIATLVIFPLLKKFKEANKLSKKEGASTFSSNKQSLSATQGFYNSQATGDSSGQSSQNNNLNGANSQGIQRSMQNIQQSCDKNEKFKQILKQEDNQVTCIDDYNAQIKKFIGQKITFNVKQLFTDLKKKNLQANCLTFDYLMQIVLDNKSIECALELFIIFQSQVSNIQTITPSIFSLFLKAIQYGLNNEVSSDDAELMIEQLNEVAQKFNIKMVEGSTIAMIDIALRSNKLEKAMKILNELENDKSWNSSEDIQKKKCELYYQILKNLKGIFCQNDEDILNKLCQMIEYLNEKKEQENIYPDESMVNSLIDLCFQCNQAKQALEIYGYFEKFNISPSGVTYCILIKGYGQLNQYSYAMTIYQQMIKNKIPLNEVTLGCLIDTCVKCNQLEKAEEILAEEKEIKPNTIIYTTLLKGYTKQENMQKALEIFEIMKNDKDLEPNIVTYNSLMECAVQCKNKEQMRKIFNEIMEQKDESKKADLITFSTYIKGLFKYGDIDEALEIFEDLRKQESYKLDEIFYNSILDGLFKAREYTKTQQLYQKMRTDNIKPSNVTYSILVKLNSAQGKIDDALKILQEMKNQNVKPGLIVYTCLIQACIKHKNINKLLPLYEDMKKQSIRGDAVFYNTLISGLMFNRCINDALKMTIDTLERKIILNQEVYQNLLNKVVSNYEKKKNLGEVEEKEEVRSSRSYSGNIKFTSHFQAGNAQQSSSSIAQIEDELTLEEMEKYLQKILLHLRKYSIEIDIELYKQVVNHIFVHNSDEKKEYLTYVNQKGGNTMNRQTWGQRRPTYGPTSYNKNSSNSSTPTSNYTPFYNKQKSLSFYQKQRTTEGGTFNEIAENSISEQNEGGNKNTFRTNGGYNNSYNSNNGGIQNRTHSNSFNVKSSSSQSISNYPAKRFINKPRNSGTCSITDLKKLLEDEKDNQEEVDTSKGIKSNSDRKPSSTEKSKEQQSLSHIKMDELENDSHSSDDEEEIKKEKNAQKNTQQVKSSSAQKKYSYNSSSHRKTVGC